MGRIEVIDGIFIDWNSNTSTDGQIREDIRFYVKANDELSRKITTVLQTIHLGEDEIAPACRKAREMFEKARQGYLKLSEVVPSEDYYSYNDHWRTMTQRFAFLIQLTIWLEQGTVASLETVANIIGMCSEEKRTTFHLDLEDYLMGLLFLCTEVTRLALNSVTRDQFDRPKKIFSLLMHLNAGFREINLKNDQLRKRYDGLKYEVKKVEGILYDISVRGLDRQSDGLEGAENAEVGEPVPADTN